MKVNKARFWLVLASALVWVGNGWAQEHPEHPTAQKTQPKPEAEVTVADMSKAIKGFVTKDTELKGGFFLVYDAAQKKSLELTLDKVHEERLSKVSDGLYFACSDFKGNDGKMYDLDFFMKGDKSNLQVSEVSIHKVEGTPRYGWVQESGLWKKKAAEEAR